MSACGWHGPVNYDPDTAVFAAVVRDWETRFGARVVGVGADTLHLSVAAEHFAFCPDNVWQGSHPTLSAYAEQLVGVNCWTFWWD